MVSLAQQARRAAREVSDEPFQSARERSKRRPRFGVLSTHNGTLSPTQAADFTSPGLCGETLAASGEGLNTSSQLPTVFSAIMSSRI